MIETRHNFILRQVSQLGTVAISELAKALNVSEMTIRRDLREMENLGLLRRTLGGAASPTGRSYEPPLFMRNQVAVDAKARIGKAAADFVETGESIALDIGSTTFELAKNLITKRNLTVLTPSLNIANLFINKPEIRTIITGGIIRSSEGSLIGQLPILAFEELFVDKAFLALGGLSCSAHCSEFNWEDSLVKKAMIKSAREVIAVVDSTKFEVTAFTQVCKFTSLSKLITNERPKDGLYEELRRNNVEVIVA